VNLDSFATPLFNIINLDFTDPFDVDQMLKELKDFAVANPDKNWVRAGSHGVGVLNPSKVLLDSVIPDRPVIVISLTPKTPTHPSSAQVPNFLAS
jgi:hypothetical protein